MDDYNKIGLRVLNANTLELIDSMYTAPGVPWTIEFSPEGDKLYTAWNNTPSFIYDLFEINIKPLTINKKIRLLSGCDAVVSNSNKNLLITFGSKGIQIFNRGSLSLIYQDTLSIKPYRTGIVAANNSNMIYYPKYDINKDVVGFGVFNLDLFKTIDSVIVFNNTIYKGLEGSNLLISKDDKYLFFSTWNWRGLSGFGSFFVIDIANEKILEEYKVGAFSQLANSPDGQSVYISDPGGYLYNFPSTGKIWKYDIRTSTISVLINDLYYSDRITVANDNRTLFITPFVVFNMKDGKQAWLVKIDVLMQRIIDYLPVSYDSANYFSNMPRRLSENRIEKWVKDILFLSRNN